MLLPYKVPVGLMFRVPAVYTIIHAATPLLYLNILINPVDGNFIELSMCCSQSVRVIYIFCSKIRSNN